MRRCEWMGCPGAAKWWPRLVFVGTEDPTGVPAVVTLRINTCDGHRGELTVEQILGADGFRQFVELFERCRIPPPVREFIVLEWQRAMWVEDN